MAAFTQRVVALVELVGGRGDRERFEEECGRRGWAVLERPGDVGGGEHSRTATRFVVELRLFGVAWNSTWGALEQVRTVGRRLELTVRVLTAERVVAADPDKVPMWRAVVGPVPVERWARFVVWVRPWWPWAVRPTLASRRVWAAGEEEALRLVRRALPGVVAAPAGVGVRSEFSPSPHASDRLRNLCYVVMVWVFLVLVGRGSGAALPALGSGPALTVAVGLALVVAGIAGVLFVLRRPWNLGGEQQQLGGRSMAFALCLFAGGLGARAEDDDTGVAFFTSLMRVL